MPECVMWVPLEVREVIGLPGTELKLGATCHLHGGDKTQVLWKNVEGTACDPYGRAFYSTQFLSLAFLSMRSLGLSTL